MRIETEVKYYCLEPEKLIKMAEKKGFKKVVEQEEIDEYFSDINGKYIENRTCLRLRRQKDDKLEITYKGKSDALMGVFCKLENNISVSFDNYDRLVSLFSSLGYYSYVKVIKKRAEYELIEDGFKYHIMIDSLPEIGGFVEFEIISENNGLSKDELKRMLYKFVLGFEELNLKEANKPYRDIVANYLYRKMIKNKEIESICINIDEKLKQYEKDFYKKYKNDMKRSFHCNIKWGEYKKNKSMDNEVVTMIDDYLENFIFDGNEFLLTLELLKKINYKKYFITKVNSVFFERIINKFNIKDIEALYIGENETIVNVLNKNNIKKNKSIILNDKNLKENNSLLMVLINES